MRKSTTGPNLIRRALSVAVCYVLALQAFLAAYGTAFAISRVGAFDSGFAICRGADGPPPANGDSEKPEQAPCALCAVAAAAGGLLHDPVTVAPAPLVICGSIDAADTSITLTIPPPRAGLSRAPPSLV